MRAVLVPVLATLWAGGAAFAQSVPAELPPEGYSERQFVDSLGCVFQRVGISGALAWVPRLGADNQPVCGETPTFAAAPAAAPPDETETTATTEPATPEAKPAPAEAKAKVRKAARKLPLTLVETETLDAESSLCLARIPEAERYWVSDGRRVTKCGPGADDSVAFLNGLGAPGLTVEGTDDSPEARAAARALGRDGYRVTWSNGPIKDQPAVAPQDAVQGAGWIQIGAFAQPANAVAAVADLQGLGLPAARQTVRQGRLTAILAGPFASAADRDRALALLRRSGYPAAFPRG